MSQYDKLQPPFDFQGPIKGQPDWSTQGLFGNPTQRAAKGAW